MALASCARFLCTTENRLFRYYIYMKTYCGYAGFRGLSKTAELGDLAGRVDDQRTLRLVVAEPQTGTFSAGGRSMLLLLLPNIGLVNSTGASASRSRKPSGNCCEVGCSTGRELRDLYREMTPAMTEKVNMRFDPLGRSITDTSIII